MSYASQLLFSFNKMLFARKCLSTDLLNGMLPAAYHFQKNLSCNPRQIRDILAIAYPANISPESITDHLSRGKLLYTASHQDKIIAYSWISVSSHYLPYVDAVLTLGANEFYAFGSSVHPSFRGRGLINLLRDFAYCDQLRSGRTLAITSHMSWNTKIANANRKYGFEYWGAVTYGYFLLFRFFINRMPPGKLTHQGSPCAKWRQVLSLLRSKR